MYIENKLKILLFIMYLYFIFIGNKLEILNLFSLKTINQKSIINPYIYIEKL